MFYEEVCTMITQGNLGNQKPITDPGCFQGLQIGKVISVYPDSHCVDIALLRGGVARKVQVLAPYASSDTGVAFLPKPGLVSPEQKLAGIVDTPRPGSGRNVFAVVGYLEGQIHSPVCLGFLFPDDAELLSLQAGVQVDRREGGTYIYAGDDGEFNINHPSGIHIHIGRAAGAKTLDNTFNKRWKDGKNAVPEFYFSLKHFSGATISVDPDGNIQISAGRDRQTGNRSHVTITGNTVSVVNAGP